jgi:hypothetical protein
MKPDQTHFVTFFVAAQSIERKKKRLTFFCKCQIGRRIGRMWGSGEGSHPGFVF